jgi:hypothetical protein
MKFVPLLLPGHFLIQPLFQRFYQLAFGDVRILLLPFILDLCLHKQTVFFTWTSREASTGDEGEERVGPLIYSGKYLFNKSKFYLEKFLIL